MTQMRTEAEGREEAEGSDPTIPVTRSTRASPRSHMAWAHCQNGQVECRQLKISGGDAHGPCVLQLSGRPCPQSCTHPPTRGDRHDGRAGATRLLRGDREAILIFETLYKHKRVTSTSRCPHSPSPSCPHDGLLETRLREET